MTLWTYRLFSLFIYLYPLIHSTDDYLSENITELMFGEITNSHPHSTVSVSRYLVRNIVIFTHFIISPTLRMHNKSSVTTYMISNYQYRLIWNFTVVAGFSAVSPRPNSYTGLLINAKLFRYWYQYWEMLVLVSASTPVCAPTRYHVIYSPLNSTQLTPS